jgi:hypothetical protein
VSLLENANEPAEGDVLTASSESPYQFVIKTIDIRHEPFGTYFLPKFSATQLQLFYSPFKILYIVFDHVRRPPYYPNVATT